MEQVYNQKLISKIHKRLCIEVAIILISLIITFLALFVLYSLKTPENVIVLSLVSAFITTLEVIFVVSYGVSYFLYDLEYNRFINRVSARKPDKVQGKFVFVEDKKYSYRRVTFYVLDFDCGDKYREETVLRNLYIEHHLANDFVQNCEYRLLVVDNAILSYEEVNHETN